MIFCTLLSTTTRYQLRIDCSSIPKIFSQLSRKHSDPLMIALNGCTKPGKSCKLMMEEEEKKTQGEKEERN